MNSHVEGLFIQKSCQVITGFVVQKRSKTIAFFLEVVQPFSMFVHGLLLMILQFYLPISIRKLESLVTTKEFVKYVSLTL